MRDKILEGIIYFFLGILLIGFFNLQVVKGSRYRELSENNRIRTIPVIAARGRIYDCNGVVLADNRSIYNLSIVPQDFDPRYYDRLAAVLDDDRAVLDDVLAKYGRSSQPILLKRDISRTDMYRLEELSSLVGGLEISEDSLRFYPKGKSTCHIVGYIGKINAEEYAENRERGWLINDYIGRLGVEKTSNEILMGKPGGKQVEVDARGKIVRQLSKKEPELGRDVHLTIDAELQQRVLDMINPLHKVAVCMVDVHTGAILVLVSTPEFDPNMFLDQKRKAEMIRVLQSSEHPFVNRTISLAYPPGSIWKVLIGLAALEERKIGPSTTFVCKGEYRLSPNSRPFKCWNPFGHGELTLPEAIARSCNVFFYQVGLRLGNQQISRYAHMFGFGEVIDLGLPFARSGVVPDAVWKQQKFNERWYPGETVNFSIGQGFLEVTPLQVARMMATIANNGVDVEPHVIKGKAVKKHQLPISTKNFSIMRGCMLRAIDAEYGTGHLAQPMYYKMAGKTGTAQAGAGREPHSWYAGFYPYENPQIALVVMAENAGPGGVVAAGYAGRIADEWLAYEEAQKSNA